MSWNWSHTAEGMQNVETNIRSLDDVTLATVYAEWSCATLVDGVYHFAEKKYPIAFATAMDFINGDARDMIEECVIDKTNQHAECDNGGFDAHICPFGCHTVPFDLEEDDD